MQRVDLPVIGGESVSRSVAVSNQQTVNLITAVTSPGAKAGAVLESAPGLVDLEAIGSGGACRSPHMVNWKGNLYGAFGDQLVSLDSLNVVTTIGTLARTTGHVRIARGRNYLMVVDETAGYTWDGTTFAAIADADFLALGRTTHVVYLDGFFIVNDADTDNWYISALEDPTSWNALDFEAASVGPDAALALAATDSILYLIGEETTELYYNSGNVDFPYSRYLNATQEIGILAPHSLAESDAGVFWLATTPEGGRFVARMQGTSPSIVSQDEQEAFLAGVGDPTTAYGFIYKQAGKSFYVLHVPDAGCTLVYNIRAGIWERRELQDGTGWRAGGHGIQNSRNIVGSRLAARFYQLSLATYTDAGEELIRRRRTQVHHVRNQFLDWHQLVLDFQPGVGTVTDPGSDPVVRMRYSDDYGASWSRELVQRLGRQGEAAHRAVWHNLGQSRNRIFEFECSDPVPFTIIGGYAYVDVLND